MSPEPEVIEDAEVIEPGMELEVVGPAPTTLFHTDDPVEIVAKATAIANALGEVLKAKGLAKRIGNREFVQVEGWTLCGTMLGVFAVIEWTRKLDNGWEARASARTLSGAEVGAAEAECLRSESKWADRDDYALRSMAQTRAVSKALRAPLGFVVQLAGFAPTPAEEMPDDEPVAERRVEGPPPYPVPKSWPKVLEAATKCDNAVESEALYSAFLRAATYHVYGKTSLKELDSSDERKVMLQKAATAVCWLHDTGAGADGPFYFYTEAVWRQAWAQALDGHLLEIPDYVPPEPVDDDEVERLARLSETAQADAGDPYS